MISAKDYAVAVTEAQQFLEGKSLHVIRRLEERMQIAVDCLAFEEAARIRDQIKSLRHIQEQQHVVRLRGDVDVIVMQVSPGFACVYWMMVRQGQVLDNQTFLPKVPRYESRVDDLKEQVFERFIAHFYQDHPTRIPPLIVTDVNGLTDTSIAQVLTAWRGRSCRITTRVRGVNAHWLQFAKTNLQQACSEHDHALSTQKARIQALQQALTLVQPIKRLLCFDISHTQGHETVAACVVFDEHGPCKRAYRRFYLRDITPGDDYAAINQAVTRYLARLSSDNWPEVIIVDGGKGQVAQAQEALKAYQKKVKLIGIVKGLGRKACFDRIYDADLEAEIVIADDDSALHLVQHMRDEAHRFAITLHRKKRQKNALSSSLLTIPGVGPKRRHALLQRFGGLRELSKATAEEIAKVDGVSERLAKEIYQHCHGN